VFHNELEIITSDVCLDLSQQLFVVFRIKYHILNRNVQDPMLKLFSASLMATSS
jgi:hypothetical protein